MFYVKLVQVCVYYTFIGLSWSRSGQAHECEKKIYITRGFEINWEDVDQWRDKNQELR